MTEKSLVTLKTIAGILSANGHASSKAKAHATLVEAFDLVGAALRAGDDVQIKGFGSFRVLDTIERPGRNPKTGETVTVPAGRRIKFKASKKVLQGFIRDEEAVT